ncbi:MAG: DUF1232 domain-containing protein [Saprospiraceae bacterium]|nr:DUF1232 domain-containing protein [Saprospiraceae bacterium]
MKLLNVDSSKRVLNFISSKLKLMGTRLAYSTLLMYYAYKSEQTPAWAKRIILGSFAYLLSPLDSIPDLTPIFGFTDDLGVISFGLVSIACYIDATVRENAKTKLMSFFKNVSVSDLERVDALL